MARQQPMISEQKQFFGFYGVALLVLLFLFFLAVEWAYIYLTSMVRSNSSRLYLFEQLYVSCAQVAKNKLEIDAAPSQEIYPAFAQVFFLAASRCFEWSETPEGEAFQPYFRGKPSGRR